MIFGTENVLTGFKRDEEAGALAVGDDAGNSERMVGKGDDVADFDVAGLSDDIVGEGFVWSLERTAVTKDKSLAEGVKTFVIDGVNDDETFGIREDEGGSRFVDVGELGHLIVEGFRHDRAGESKEDGGVGRLDEKIGADAFDALSPFGDDAAGETDDHEDQHYLDGNGEDAEGATEGARSEIAPEHAQERKRAIVRVRYGRVGQLLLGLQEKRDAKCKSRKYLKLRSFEHPRRMPSG